MTIFAIVIFTLIMCDFFVLEKQKNRRAMILYFTLAALILTGAGFYYANPYAPSFTMRIMEFL
jgi:hypothetical protein